jgi:Cys-rich four helix bundle protein (predicted Tat secretion target)
MLFAMGATTVAASALQGVSQEMPMPHHHMGGAKNQALIDTAARCSSAAELCTSHCIEMIIAGDKTMAACAAGSREVAVVCNGLRALAALDSAHLKMYAKVAEESCKSCAAECQMHAANNAVCKNCADACTACAAECGKLA